MIRRVVLGSLPFLIHLTQQPHRGAQWRHNLYVAGNLRRQWQPSYSFLSVFPYSVLHCVTRPACSAAFHYFPLKNIKQISDDRIEVFSRPQEQSHSFAINRQGDFLRHFPFCVWGVREGPVTWMIRAMRDGAGRVSGQCLHSITRTSYRPRTFMLVAAEVVPRSAPFTPRTRHVRLLRSLCLFVCRDVALATAFTWHGGGGVSTRCDDPHPCEVA